MESLPLQQQTKTYSSNLFWEGDFLTVNLKFPDEHQWGKLHDKNSPHPFSPGKVS